MSEFDKDLKNIDDDTDDFNFDHDDDDFNFDHPDDDSSSPVSNAAETAADALDDIDNFEPEPSVVSVGAAAATTSSVVPPEREPDHVPSARGTKKEKGSRISYEKKKQLYGYGFIGLWLLGTLYFFIYPIIISLQYAFHDTSPIEGGMKMDHFGIQNFTGAFRVDRNYSKALVTMLGNTALKTPLIVIFSIFIAVILNQKFKGRTFARAVFFLPVIIATGPVIDIINGNMGSSGANNTGEQFSTMFEANLVDQLLNFLGIYNISDKLTEIINTLTSDIFNLVWNSGIQILLFLSALQGIPFSAKEAAQMEGATSWEYFWKITIPYISPQILTCIVYTIVDSFVDPSNNVMKLVLNKQADWAYGYAAAMAWIYFAIIGVVLAIVVAIVNKFVYYEVE